MQRLYILYDARCGLCSRLRAWIVEQPAYCAIDFVPAGSPRARQLFPELPHDEAPSELVAITDDGDVYFADAAWIVCLWALAEYRQWSLRLARPPLRRLARGAWEMISRNRAALSRTFALKSDAQLACELEKAPVTSCDVDPAAAASTPT